MKKRIQIKLSLNRQTIRSLQTPGLKDVQGGLAALRETDDTMDLCYTTVCATANCRGCG